MGWDVVGWGRDASEDEKLYCCAFLVPLITDTLSHNFYHRSPNDNRLFIVQEHDPDMLSKSFDELHLFADSSGDLVSVSI